ncbi:hypothetical protein M0805_003325 [Coniferiporia weirii]|nr:hypothetical protein M0805_003325 [Coniferiporia weirii]
MTASSNRLIQLVALLAVTRMARSNSTLSVPPNAVYIDPFSFPVLGTNGSFRNASEAFNPTNATPPVFQVFSREFLDVLGPTPSIRVIAQNESFAFAHEAPVWIPATNELFFASNGGGALGNSGLNANNQVSRINLTEAEASDDVVAYKKVPLSDESQMSNGATPYRGEFILMNQGRGALPPTIMRVHPHAPYNSTVLLDNFFGRQFNSLNDVKVHPTSGALFFCDVAYGWYQGFRPTPQIPNQVYRYDLENGSLRVVADGFDKPNGIAFSGDGKAAFVTDTGAVGVETGTNYTRPSTIYKLDVDEETQALTNRRVFAYADNGIPDGIQVDAEGRVYASCGDGVQVWNPRGTLIGKFFLGSQSSNMAFVGAGRLVILAETKVYLARIAASGQDLEGMSYAGEAEEH